MATMADVLTLADLGLSVEAYAVHENVNGNVVQRKGVAGITIITHDGKRFYLGTCAWPDGYPFHRGSYAH